MKHNPTKEITKVGDRVRVRTINLEKSRTQQQFKEQCDVNNIIAKYKKTGEFIHTNRKAGVYADVSGISDYAESMIKIKNAETAFNTLPSAVRLKFQNDPMAMIDFMQDPKNYDECVEIGLFEKKQTPSMPPAEIKNDSNDKKTASKGKREHQLNLDERNEPALKQNDTERSSGA